MPDYRMKWIRIWPHAWFDSSMRVELTNTERAFWVDVIALAGKSRIPGVICSDPDAQVGYPLPMLSSLLVSWTPEEVTRILEKLEKTKRVQVTRTPLLSGEDGWIVHVTNWQKYQSEAQRVQKYKKGYNKQVSHSTPTGCTNARIEVEGEGEGEGEVKTLRSTPANLKAPSLSVQRQNAERQINDAQKELQKDPNSPGAKRAFDEGMENLRQAVGELAKRKQMP